MSTRLPEDVVRHIALSLAFLPAPGREELLSAVDRFQQACRTDRASDRDRALGAIERIIAPALPGDVRSLNDLQRWSLDYRDHQTRKLKAAPPAPTPAQVNARFWAAYQGAKTDAGCKTPLELAHKTGLGVDTVLAIERTRARPSAKVCRVIEDALSLPRGSL